MGGILVHKPLTDDVAGVPRWWLTWRAALRPRGRTRVAHAGGARGAPSVREATRPRGRPCGATRVAGFRGRKKIINRGIRSPI